MWHQRLVLGRVACSASSFAVASPDFEVFVEDFDLGATQASGKSSKKQRVAIPENQVFDILPIRGTLKPGASEEIEHQVRDLNGGALS